MQDDFGEFLQAAPKEASNPSQLSRFPRMESKPQMGNLNTRIIQSFDLGANSQKGAMRFTQPPRPVGRRPQTAHFKPSSSAADWSNLSLQTSEFTVPQRLQAPTNQPHLDQPSLQPYIYPQNPTGPSQNPVINVQGGMTSGQPPNFTPINFSPMHSGFLPPGNMPPQNPGPQVLTGYPYMQPGMMDSHPGMTTMYQTSGQQMPKPPLSEKPMQNYTPAQPPQVKSSPMGTSLPPWMTKPNEIPPLYKKVLKHCATPNSYADTSRLYPILVSSQLPKDVLGHIWSVANQSTPGQLTFTEVYIALALIALAQTNDMNLSVKHVTSLKVPPVPNLQYNFETPTQIANIEGKTTGVFSTMITPTPMGIPHQKPPTPSDEFSDFQSTPVGVTQSLSHPNLIHSTAPQPLAQSVLLPTTTGTGIVHSNDFDDFQQFSQNQGQPVLKSQSDFGGFGTAPAVAPTTFPDRSLINSPMSTSITDIHKLSSNSSLESMTGPGNKNKVEFSQLDNAIKSDITWSAPKMPFPAQSNPSTISSNVTTSSSNLDFDDFGEFKSNTFDSNSASFPKVDPPKPTRVLVPPIMEAKVPDTTDKYSALRDLFPPVNDAPMIVENASDETQFTDFQTFPATESKETISDLFSTLGPDQINSATSEKPAVVPAMPLKPNLERLGWGTEDSSSVKSLELPSLSEKISNLSIGTSSPIKVNEPDDGLYSLDEPISPPARQNKIYSPDKFSAPSNDFVPFSSATAPFQDPKPVSDSSRERRAEILRKISEAESDFGDFAAAPPPLDDNSDFNSEFDVYQTGNSSLVDFDAFGHFEEAKFEKKDERHVKRSNKKEETTAYSEILKSSGEVVNATVIVGVKSTSEKNLSPSEKDDNSDWSCFNKDRENIDSIAQTVPTEISITDKDEKMSEGRYTNLQVVDLDLNNEIIKEAAEPVGTSHDFDDFKMSEYDAPPTIQPDWDQKEAEDLKARLAGTVTSNSMELYADHWGRCLATCKDIIESTGQIFATLNSPAVCHEIVNSTRGREFISCTSEVYGVGRRIRRGMESVELQDDDLDQVLKDIEIAWNNLLGFCPYTPSVHKTPEHCPKSAENQENDNSPCSLCLLSTEGENPVGLSYGGKFYHAPCANLWLNQVAPILPRLVPPGK